MRLHCCNHQFLRTFRVKLAPLALLENKAGQDTMWVLHQGIAKITRYRRADLQIAQIPKATSVRTNLRWNCDLFRVTQESRELSDDLDPQATLYVTRTVVNEACYWVTPDELAHLLSLLGFYRSGRTTGTCRSTWNGKRILSLLKINLSHMLRQQHRA